MEIQETFVLVDSPEEAKVVKMNGEFMHGVQEIKFEAGVSNHPSLTVKFIPNITSPAKEVPSAPPEQIFDGFGTNEIWGVESVEKPVLPEAESNILDGCSGHPVTPEDELVRQERRQRTAARRAETANYVGIIEALWPVGEHRQPEAVLEYIDGIEDETKRARVLNAVGIVAGMRNSREAVPESAVLPIEALRNMDPNTFTEREFYVIYDDMWPKGLKRLDKETCDKINAFDRGLHRGKMPACIAAYNRVSQERKNG